jgi:hypothetical protein
MHAGGSIMQTTRRHALSLAAVLAATVLTGGGAILGLVHKPAAASTQAVPAAVVQQAPAGASQNWEEGDR